jgi:hypothetical protein
MGPPSSNQTPSQPHARRPATPPGATVCSHPSRRDPSSCDSSGTATRPAAMCRICRADGSARRPMVKPARHSPSTSLGSCGHGSAPPGRPAPQTRGGGTGLAPVSSRGPVAPCLIPRRDRRRSASRRSSALLCGQAPGGPRRSTACRGPGGSPLEATMITWENGGSPRPAPPSSITSPSPHGQLPGSCARSALTSAGRGVGPTRSRW